MSEPIVELRKAVAVLLEHSEDVRITDSGEAVLILGTVHDVQELMTVAFQTKHKAIGLILAHGLMSMVDEAERLLDLMVSEDES
jgi:hypothetical protein